MLLSEKLEKDCLEINKKKESKTLNHAWKECLYNLKNVIKKGEMYTRFYYSYSSDLNNNILKEISKKGIINGINIIYDYSNHFEVFIENYEMNSMYDFYDKNLNIYETRYTNALRKLEQFLMLEAKCYECILDNVDLKERIIEKDAIDENILNDAIQSAYYRLGYEADPHYEKYIEEVLKDTKLIFDSLNDKENFLRIVQYITNCFEISHIKNSKKNKKFIFNKIRKRGN